MKKIKGTTVFYKEVYGKIIVRYKNDLIEKRLVDNINKEKKDFLKAIEACKEKIINTKTKEDYPFLEAHLLILDDPCLIKEVNSYLDNESCNASFAVFTIMNLYIDKIRNAEDLYLRERYLDLCDIRNQIISYLNNSDDNLDISENTILVVDDLYASDVLNLDEKIKGIISFDGGLTSHSAILCKSFNVPYIVVPRISNINEFSTVLLKKNHIILDPKKVTTIDENENNIYITNKEVNVLANINSNDELEFVKKRNFYGIGLYRTEFLFIKNNKFLSTEEQQEIYKEALKMLYPKKVFIRTFDLGLDKHIPGYTFVQGVKNYELHRDLFDYQITALLKSNPGNLNIMFPYIKTKEEFLSLKKRVLDIKSSLKNKVPLKIGMMIETKEAALNIIDFKESDFFSIGSNDLLLNLFNLKRDEISSSKKYIRKDFKKILKKIVSFTQKQNIYLSICGELVLDSYWGRKLYKMGITNYSISIYNLDKFNEMHIKKGGL